MNIRHLMMVFAASSLIAAPAMAAPVGNPAMSLSLANSRASSHTGHKDKLAGTGLVIALVAAAAIGTGIYFAVRKTNPASN